MLEEPYDLLVLPPGLPNLGWKLEEKLGEGSFGAVYKASVAASPGDRVFFTGISKGEAGSGPRHGTEGTVVSGPDPDGECRVDFDGELKGFKTNIRSLKRMEASYVAVKLERLSQNKLAEEQDGLKKLADASEGFCKLKCDVFAIAKYRVLVMDMLGPSLQKMFDDHGPLNLQTLLLLACQMLRRLEYIHGKNILHRDIKPDNMCIGYGANANIAHLIDFGLATRWQGSQPMFNLNLIGTARYCSLNVSKGERASRRDDVEGLAYTLIYLHQTRLPWMGVAAPNKLDKYAMIRKIKEQTSLDKLCQQGHVEEGLPFEFVDFLAHCRGLSFERAPDYAYLLGLMTRVVDRKGFLGLVFQWHPSEVTTQDDMVGAFIDILSRRGRLVKKANEPPVMARLAQPGEQVTTIINGEAVAVSVVEDDDAKSMVVRAPTDDHEFFVLSETKFAEFFCTQGWDITDVGPDFDDLVGKGFMYYKRKGDTLVYQVTEHDMKQVPSGQFYVPFSSIPQPLRVGDFIATPAEAKNEVYLYKCARYDASKLQPTTQQQMVEAFVKSPDKLAQGKLIQKSGVVLARRGIIGEVVSTVIGGILVSKSEVREENSMVVIVRDPTAEQYRLVYSKESFDRFFDHLDPVGSNFGAELLSRTPSQISQNFEYFHRKGATLVYQVTQQDMLHYVPSGQFRVDFSDMPQPLRAGNYIATPADTKDEVYLYSHVKDFNAPAASDLVVEGTSVIPDTTERFVDPKDLRLRFESMNLKALKANARKVGIGEQTVQDADYKTDPKDAVIQMISARLAEMRSDLQGMSLKALKTKARELGVIEQTIQDVDAEDCPKEAAIQIILGQQVAH